MTKKFLVLHAHNVKRLDDQFYNHLTFSTKGLIKIESVLKKIKNFKFLTVEVFLKNERDSADEAILKKDVKKIKEILIS